MTTEATPITTPMPSENKKKHPKRVGMSCKNKRFIKSGLTEYEKAVVKRTMDEINERWKHLFSLNKYTK